MKIKDLKKFLEKYPDDMDIKMELPMVGDWADIKLHHTKLQRMKKEEFVGMCNWQNKEYKLGRKIMKLSDPDVKKRKMEWEFAQPGLNKQLKIEDVYEYKEAIVITNKPRGKSSFDRMGTIEY